MALTKCKECGKQVSKKAETCPHCGFSFKKAKEENSTAIGCLVLIAIIAGLWMWISSIDLSSEPTPWQERDNSTMAYIMAEDFVKDRLVSPSSADFPGILDGRADHVERKANHVYVINSYVDSQNRMGGTLRSKFRAELKQTSEDEWQLINLVIE